MGEPPPKVDPQGSAPSQPWVGPVARPTLDRGSTRCRPAVGYQFRVEPSGDLWSHFVNFRMGQPPGLCWLTTPGSTNPGSRRRPRGSSYHVSTWVGGLTLLGLLEAGGLRPSCGSSLRCKMYGGWGSGSRDQGFALRALCSAFVVYGSGLRVQLLIFKVTGG